MKTHTFSTSMTLPLPIEEVFAFFSDAGNLQMITPPELKFNIVTPMPLELKEGAFVEYRLKLAGKGFGWLTKVTEWNPPFSFTDEQLKGPYKLWIHRHTFSSSGDATVIKDTVTYQLPFYPFGELVHPVIKLQLRRIFSYRQKQIRKLLLPVRL